MMVSHCCSKEVIKGTKHEYPLGGTTWYETFETTICSGCGNECEDVPGCDWCGEGAADGELVHVGMDRMHQHCKEEFMKLNPGVAI